MLISVLILLVSVSVLICIGNEMSLSGFHTSEIQLALFPSSRVAKTMQMHKKIKSPSLYLCEKKQQKNIKTRVYKFRTVSQTLSTKLCSE